MEGRINVHKARSMWPSAINKDLVKKVDEEKLLGSALQFLT